MKVCNKCKISKALEEFNHSSDSKDGHRNTCRECMHAAYKTWRDKNKERAITACRDWRAANKDKVRINNRAWNKANKERVRAVSKIWKDANKERNRQYRITFAENNPKEYAEGQLRYKIKKYGLTVEEFQQMLENQGGVCAICGKPQTRTMKSGEKFQLAVDHDHKTGKVRGLLCTTCNQLLGLLEKIDGGLEKVSNYLMESV